MEFDVFLAIGAAIVGVVTWLSKISFDLGYIRRRFDELGLRAGSTSRRVSRHTHALREHAKRLAALEQREKNSAGE